jgi:hypothetical protein
VGPELIDQLPHGPERLLDSAQPILERDDLAREPWGRGEHHARDNPAHGPSLSISQA